MDAVDIISVQNSMIAEKRLKLEKFFKQQNIKYDYKAQAFIRKGRIIDIDDIVRIVNLQDKEYRVDRYKQRHLIEQYIFEVEEEALDNLSEEILKYNKENTKELKKFVTLITKTKHKKLRIEKILKYFIWQVKRRIAGMEIKQRIFPVFVSPNCLHIANSFVSPLDKFVSRLTFTYRKRIVDKRKLSKNFVLIAENVERMPSRFVDSICDAADRDVITYNKDKLQINATCIFTSSVSAAYGYTNYDFLYDIFCKLNVPQKRLDSIDFEKIWHSVDHTEPMTCSGITRKDSDNATFVEDNLFYKELDIRMANDSESAKIKKLVFTSTNRRTKRGCIEKS
jgi:hypothetical protein